jgi:hypothetical protein
MSNSKKYGEETKMVSFRVPESKESEIKQIVKLKLNEYEKSALIKESVVIDNKIPKWKIEVEKKSNPTDYISDEAGQFSLKVPVEKFGDTESEIIGVGKLTTVSKKNVDMDALRKIASGEGLKGEFQLTKKKVDIEEKYAFVYAKSIPDQDEQIPLDKKGISFYSKYDLGVFYVKWEGKYIRFDEKAEFDRFANDNLIML